MTPRVAHIETSSPAPIALMASSAKTFTPGPVALKAANDMGERGKPTLLVRRRRRHNRRAH